MTEPTAKTVPKLNASVPETRPRGKGRAVVRAIRASISASYHILSAPDAPAPTAIDRIAINPMTGCNEPGAATIAASAVKMTSVMTRGFISWM